MKNPFGREFTEEEKQRIEEEREKELKEELLQERLRRFQVQRGDSPNSRGLVGEAPQSEGEETKEGRVSMGGQ